MFTEFTEYTVALDDTLRIDTFLRREDGTVEPVTCRLYYYVASIGTGNFTCVANNVIRGEGLGDAMMYFTYEGVRSGYTTIHIIQPIH